MPTREYTDIPSVIVNKLSGYALGFINYYLGYMQGITYTYITRYIEKNSSYLYDCFAMTMYKSLLYNYNSCRT